VVDVRRGAIGFGGESDRSSRNPDELTVAETRYRRGPGCLRRCGKGQASVAAGPL
jgi:hypothetical protein